METPNHYIYPFDLFIAGCDVPYWIPHMTASELGLDRAKLTIDFQTGRSYVSYPVGWKSTESAAVASA